MNSKIYILTPCYNDWESLSVLLENINKENEKHANSIHVVVVNDGSSQDNLFEWNNFQFIEEVIQVDLIRNVGHQRAISIGLAYINSSFTDYKGVIVMDCDGEDDYRDAFRLMDESSPDEIIFAKRRKRSESFLFRMFYSLYKFIFKLLTGHVLQGGNFSFIPHSMLNKVIHLSEIWNHYHAGILKSRLKIKYVDCDRAPRYKGKSKMNFTSLVVHGLSSVSVFNDIVFVKLTLFSIVFLVLTLLGIAFVLFLKFALERATPGWATTVIGVLLILCTQFLLMVVNSTFTVLGGRNTHAFLPHQEYTNYIMDIHAFYNKH